MSKDAEVRWYEEDVKLAVDAATDEFLTQLAFQGEGEAKVGATVDTGFMRNAIYGLGPQSDHRSRAMSEARSAASDREVAPVPELGEHEAAIHGAAGYTIYQEMKHHFMYHALEKLAQIAGGTIQSVGKKHLG